MPCVLNVSPQVQSRKPVDWGVTRLLTRADVMRLLEPLLAEDALLPKLREGFRIYSLERTLPAQRASSPLPGGDAESFTKGATVLFPGLLPHIPAYTAKVHAKFPGQDPAIRGLVLLHDLSTGALLAVLESSVLTAVRTALSGAVAADVLARGDAARVAVIGAGVQGAWGLRALRLVRRLERVSVYDTAPFKTGLFVRRMAEEVPAKLVPADFLAEAVMDADIVITATWSTFPFLFPGMVPEGAHVTTLGADEPGKAEVSAELIETSRFFCDDRDLTLTVGALGNVGLGGGEIDAELGEVIAGTRAGRTGADDITIYGGVGLAWQDLVVAWEVFERAEARGVGLELDFLS